MSLNADILHGFQSGFLNRETSEWSMEEDFEVIKREVEILQIQYSYMKLQ